jgi:hypothetical protein
MVPVVAQVGCATGFRGRERGTAWNALGVSEQRFGFRTPEQFGG